MWEGAMSADLAPLFGPSTITKSLDSKINNRDVRVLIDPFNSDVIVYGFLDRNTLLITNSRETFSVIATLAQ